MLFEDPGRRSSSVGVTVSPVRVASIEQFGDLEAVGKRLLDAERKKVSMPKLVGSLSMHQLCWSLVGGAARPQLAVVCSAVCPVTGTARGTVLSNPEVQLLLLRIAQWQHRQYLHIATKPFHRQCYQLFPPCYHFFGQCSRC